MDANITWADLAAQGEQLTLPLFEREACAALRTLAGLGGPGRRRLRHGDAQAFALLGRLLINFAARLETPRRSPRRAPTRRSADDRLD